MKSLVVVLLGLVVSCSGYGMFEDQIGKFDWFQEYVGKMKLAVFERAAVGGGRRVFVATEKNVLAALNPKTGGLLWRKVLEDSPSSSIEFLGYGENLVTASRDGLVRGWDPLTGGLHWQFDIGMHAAGRGDWELFSLDESDNVYVFRYSLSEKTISARLYKAGNWAANASPAAEHLLPVEWMRESTRCAVVGQVLSCLNAQEQSLALLDITGIQGTEPVEFVFPSLHSVESAGDFWTRILQGGTTRMSGIRGLETLPYVLIQSDVGGAIILSVRTGEELKLQMLARLPHAVHVSGSIWDDTSYVVYLDGQDRVHAVDLSTGARQPGFEGKLSIGSNRGKIQLLHSQVSVRKETSAFACRLLLSMEDHSMVMQQVPGSSGLLWTREESLASISAVEMIDLPMSFREVSVEKEFLDGGGPFQMFVQRLKTQWIQLQALGMAVLGFVEHEIGLVPDEKPRLERDEFNLHKLIVAATKSGKVFGIESLNGTIIWSSFFPHLAPFSKELGTFKHIPHDMPKFDEGKILLFHQRTTSHYPHLPLMSIVGTNKHTGNGLRISINPVSGEVTDGPPDGDDLGFRPAVVAMTHQAGDDHLHPVVLLGKDCRVECHPSTAVKTLHDLKHRLYFYIVDHKTGLVRGYGLGPSTEQELKAEEVWQLQFPVDDQSLTLVKGKSIWEKVHSPGRVMGDRSVLYKYLNPNLFVVVGEGYDPNSKYFVNVYLVDGVTGQVVTSANHKRAKGPVHVEHSENWVVYSYFNEKYRRMEVATMSLYEGTVEREGQEFSSLFPPPNQLMIEKQSYILPAGSVTAMRTTVTEKGITSRHVLLSIPSGHVVEMPWSWLDPMRPMQMAHMTRVEDLPPYVPELALPMEARVNYNRTLHRVDDIYTAPSGLESTCLMLAYGLDLFSTRVTPSKTFDVLKDDFDHVLICLVLAGLTAASFVSKHLAARKALAHAWR